jgi:hypothetical protein
MEKPQFAVGIIAPTPQLVDQFFNASTGESQYGESDFVGPWNHGNGLVMVESEIKGGGGLDVSKRICKRREEDLERIGVYDPTRLYRAWFR